MWARECVPGDMVEKLLHSHMVMNNCCPRANELLMAALGHTLQWLKSPTAAGRDSHKQTSSAKRY